MSTASKLSDFFVAGGTLHPNAPSYVERPADEELFNLALTGEFCYVLTPRQMGKSSLMIRTARRLQEEGVRTVIIDLTEIGLVEIDAWYLGLLTELSRALRLSVNPEAWWQERASLGQVQRFTSFLRDVVLAEIKDPIVFFIDEIDTTLNLNFRDDFFAAIRAIYNARAKDLEFNRLTFILLGVASPSDLIKDRTRTPFNIGQGITLNDFTLTDARVLQAGLEANHPTQGEAIFSRIHHWTNGHPYLTQKLCQAVAKADSGPWDDERIDSVVERLFLSKEVSKEANLKFIRDKLLNQPKQYQLLDIYRKVYNGKRIRDDEQSLLQNQLKLSGLVKVENGYLEVRNQIYRNIFNVAWVKESTPINRAYVVGVTIFIALLSVTVLLLLLGLDIQSLRKPGGLLSSFWPVPPPPMPNGFNIAVAEFTALDNATGSLTSTQESQELSDWLFATIEQNTNQLPSTLRLNIRGPDQVGVILGTNHNTRTANAAQVAAAHNATLVIYGVITQSNGSHFVQPEFYVSENSFGYGSEVISLSRLGQPIPFNPPLQVPSTLSSINKKLYARIEALQHLIIGLDYFYLDRYGQAEVEFQYATNIEGWQPDEGQEVAYLLLGAAKLRSYDSTFNPEQLLQASEAFQTASMLNPGYAPSYLGLGDVALRQATAFNLGSPDSVNNSKLIEARDWYLKSLSAPDQPTSAYVPIKAAYGLGQAHLVGFEQGIPGWSRQQAEQFFNQVTSAYEAEPVPDLAWFAGQAYASQGLLTGLDGDWKGMSSNYRRAIDVLNTLPRKSDLTLNRMAVYWARIAFAEEKLNRLDAAHDAYSQAIIVGTGNVTPEELDKWQSELDRLVKEAP